MGQGRFLVSCGSMEEVSSIFVHQVYYSSGQIVLQGDDGPFPVFIITHQTYFLCVIFIEYRRTESFLRSKVTPSWLKSQLRNEFWALLWIQGPFGLWNDQFWPATFDSWIADPSSRILLKIRFQHWWSLDSHKHFKGQVWFLYDDEIYKPASFNPDDIDDVQVKWFSLSLTNFYMDKNWKKFDLGYQPWSW